MRRKWQHIVFSRVFNRDKVNFSFIPWNDQFFKFNAVFDFLEISLETFQKEPQTVFLNESITPSVFADSRKRDFALGVETRSTLRLFLFF